MASAIVVTVTVDVDPPRRAAQLGRAGADRALARLDSLIARGPPVSTSLQTAANLVCAHLFALRGEPEKALAAVRRREYVTGGSRTPLSTHPREEGPPAAAR